MDSTCQCDVKCTLGVSVECNTFLRDFSTFLTRGKFTCRPHLKITWRGHDMYVNIHITITICIFCDSF